MERLQHLLAYNIREFRSRANLSQEDLAGLAALDRTYISGIERGIRNPSLQVLWRIAQALNVTVPQLLLPPNDTDN